MTCLFGGALRFSRILALIALVLPSRAVGASTGEPVAVLSMEERKGCPGTDDLADAVETQLGRTIFGDPPRRLEIRVERGVSAMTKKDRRWSAVVTTLLDGKPLGVRQIPDEAKTCKALQAELVLVVSLAADAAIRDQLTVTKPDGEIASAPRPAEPPKEALRSSAPSSSPPPFFRVEIGTGLDFGLTPKRGPALQARVALEKNFGSLELNGFGFTPQEVKFSVAGRASLWIVGVGVGYCAPRIEISRIATEVCAGFSIARFAWEGSGLETSLSGDAFEYIPSGHLRVWYPLAADWALGLTGDFQFPLVRPRFGYQGANGFETEYRTNAFGVIGALGLRYYFR